MVARVHIILAIRFNPGLNPVETTGGERASRSVPHADGLASQALSEELHTLVDAPQQHVFVGYR